MVGNRPQFIKAAAISGPLRETQEEILVHTGQHHDDSLSKVFFEELGLAKPNRELKISGGSNTSQLARMLSALEPLLSELEPDGVLVYGDTNSTLAGALAGAQAHVPVMHVEAGMRSFDKDMPEEQNRVLTDHLSSLLLCSSESSAANLRAESVLGEVEIVGDVMVDIALRWNSGLGKSEEQLSDHGLLSGSYLLVTAHRSGNVDDRGRLEAFVELMEALPPKILFPVHPRTRARLRDAGLFDRLQSVEGLALTEPLSYLEFGALLRSARAVITDSGGVQKEAYLARVPCVTLRAATEWVETVDSGWNTLVDLDIDATISALEKQLPAEHPSLYGDGHAAQRCVETISAFLAGARPPQRSA